MSTQTSPLPTMLNPDGKSLYNPSNGVRNGFDFHVYYRQEDESEKQFARELHEKVRQEFPELRVYKFWEKPVGLHPTAMFEINTFSLHETGALFSWLAVNRGPCSVLIHPNTDDPYKDHTELYTWMGKAWTLKTDILKQLLKH
ncbi:hypothetical protein EWM64_g6838 [Hericium alpestre]|uniref:Dopa 4,5-dioxygenase n=1 Tax=Hericium alpestre TaxID=135208 RepID=A0A4Y9ZQJ7_9AGAM|nr:hypothetical protein EWM64_g6838 [Hericium alpestre]